MHENTVFACNVLPVEHDDTPWLPLKDSSVKTSGQIFNHFNHTSTPEPCFQHLPV